MAAYLRPRRGHLELVVHFILDVVVLGVDGVATFVSEEFVKECAWSSSLRIVR